MSTLSYIKSPNETVIYQIDFTDFFDNVSHNLTGTPTITATSGITVDSSAIASGNKKVDITLSGGTADNTYSVSCVVDTDGGETFEDSLFIICSAEPAAASGGYTTVARAALELGVTSELEQNLLSYYINEATAKIEAYCNRNFAKGTDLVEKYEGNNTHFLYLKRTPVASISSIVYESSTLTASTYEIWDAAVGSVRRDTEVFEKSSDNDRYTVTYTGGYVLPGNPGANLPADIERACILLVKDMWHSRNRDNSIASEKVDGVYSVSYAQGQGGAGIGMAAPIEALLTPHKRWNI